MARRKLTLTVDEEVIARAHRYGAAHGTSVSRLVGEYLESLTDPDAIDGASYGPTVRRLFGILPRTVTLEDHREHLDEKYGSASG